MEISAELRERLRKAREMDEIRELCGETGVEMTEEILGAISGGDSDSCGTYGEELEQVCYRDSDDDFCDDYKSSNPFSCPRKLEIMKERCPSDCYALGKCSNVN